MNKVTTWRPIEIELHAAVADRHYFDRQVTVRFSHESGQVIAVPAFWAGDAEWKVRFTPNLPGGWRYSVTSTPADSGLNSASGGLLAAAPPIDAMPVHRHGFLRPSEVGTHLEHTDGAPFFWLGDTHWRFAAEELDHANKPGWASQFRGIVDRRVEQGFTVYQSNLLSFGDGWRTSPIWGGGVPYEDLDLEYLTGDLDVRFAYIADAGLVHALGIGWNDAVDEDPEGLARFTRYLVARYGAYPMVWTLGGETPGYEPEHRQAKLDGWRNVALAITDVDGYDHPLTAHLTNERPIAAYYQGESWFDFTLHQHGHGDLDIEPHHYVDHLSRFPGVPLVEGESFYEGITTVEHAGRRTATATMVRQAAYRAIQSGCCGYSYGAQGCWNGAWDESDWATPWGSMPWFEGIDLEGATHLGHMRRFYESIPWSELRPTTVLQSANPVNMMFHPPAVTSRTDRRVVVAYFSETSTPVGLSLTDLPDEAFRLRWFDPRRGVTIAAGEPARPVDGRISLPTKPEPGVDWVLVADSILSPGPLGRATADEFTVSGA